MRLDCEGRESFGYGPRGRPAGIRGNPELAGLPGGASFATLVGTQKEWLRRAGVIQSSRLRAPADQISADLYADCAVRLEAARHHGA